jgi:predicted CoA-binding protein
VDDPKALLRRFRHLTIIGMSATPGKDAHDVPLFMKEHGYEVAPVNPSGATMLGAPASKNLDEAPKPLGLVVLFRPGPETPAHVQAALERGADAIWLQLGIRSEESKALAARAGKPYVEDRCVRVEHQRLWGNAARPPGAA